MKDVVYDITSSQSRLSMQTHKDTNFCFQLLFVFIWNWAETELWVTWVSQNVTLGGSCSSSLSSSSAVAVAAEYGDDEEDEEDEERKNSEPLAAVSYWTLTGGGRSVWFFFIFSQREKIGKIFLNLNQVTHLISVTWINDHLNILYLFEYFDHLIIITFDDIRWLSYSKK